MRSFRALSQRLDELAAGLPPPPPDPAAAAQERARARWASSTTGERNVLEARALLELCGKQPADHSAAAQLIADGAFRLVCEDVGLWTEWAKVADRRGDAFKAEIFRDLAARAETWRARVDWREQLALDVEAEDPARAARVRASRAIELDRTAPERAAARTRLAPSSSDGRLSGPEETQAAPVPAGAERHGGTES